MKGQKVSTTIYLTPEQFARLKALSERTRVPYAVYIRDAVDKVLEQNELKLQPGVV